MTLVRVTKQSLSQTEDSDDQSHLGTQFQPVEYASVQNGGNQSCPPPPPPPPEGCPAHPPPPPEGCRGNNGGNYTVDDAVKDCPQPPPPPPAGCPPPPPPPPRGCPLPNDGHTHPQGGQMPPSGPPAQTAIGIASKASSGTRGRSLPTYAILFVALGYAFTS